MTDFKSVLVHVDDRPTSKARVELAAQVARRFDAGLEGAYLVPTLNITPTVAALLPESVVAARMREAGDAQHSAEALFRAAAAGVRDIVWSASAQPAEQALVAMARTTDIAIVGQADRAESDAAFFRGLTEAVVLAAGRPAIVVPFVVRAPTMGDVVLIAWNETRESARAVADALPLLVRARRVDIMTVESGENGGNARDDARLREFLGRHAVPVGAIHRDRIEDIAVGELLLSRAADLGSDLIVMGAYAHTRIQERILGGVTRTMLDTMTVPVLMSH
jgi:nucleotide-binding universal stress UspA family protein